MRPAADGGDPAQQAEAGVESRDLEPTAKHDPLLGRQVGEYVIRRRVGQGGMGVVFEAWHPVIERRVAIKLLLPDLAAGEGAVGSLVAEARAANAVPHRSIVDVFGFGELEGYGHYLVMEYLDGEPLSEVIQTRAPLPVEEVLRVMDEVLSALGAAHLAGVIHRDLKPSNIFIVTEPGGNTLAKILDFGLAKRTRSTDGLGHHSAPSVLIGTPEYMAPEQVLGQPAVPATDLYAMSLVAVEMLTGATLFSGTTPLATALLHLGEPPDICARCPSIPPALAKVLQGLLAKEPQDRPASAESVRLALRRVAERLGLEVRNSSTRTEVADLARLLPTPPPAVSKPRSRVPRAALFGIGIGTLAAALAGLGYVAIRPGDSGPAALPQPLPATPLPTPSVAVVPTQPVPVRPANPVPTENTTKPPLDPPAAPAEAKAPELGTVPRAPARVVRTGELQIALESGWAEVVIDNHKSGRLPKVSNFTLSAGRHVLELSNPHRQPYSASIKIEPGKTLVQKVRLLPLDEAPQN
jgi:serine/threonine-protein kinase